jgi:hypothetical protein
LSFFRRLAEPSHGPLSFNRVSSLPSRKEDDWGGVVERRWLLGGETVLNAVCVAGLKCSGVRQSDIDSLSSRKYLAQNYHRGSFITKDEMLGVSSAGVSRYNQNDYPF